MRSALEFVTTAQLCFRQNEGSISAAMEASRAAKITLGAHPCGVAGESFISATREGIDVFNFPARGFGSTRVPQERSDEAASHATSNQG